MDRIKPFNWGSYSPSRKASHANVDVQELMEMSGMNYTQQNMKKMKILLHKFSGCLYHVTPVLDPRFRQIWWDDYALIAPVVWVGVAPDARWADPHL